MSKSSFDQGGRSVSDWMLERYRLGELDPAQRAAIAGALERDADLRARLFDLDQDDAATLISYPPARMAAAFRGREAAARSRISTASWAATAAAAALLLVIGLGSFEQPIPDGERIKGAEAGIVVFRQTAAEPERLESDVQAAAGDVVQVGFKAPAESHVAVYSIDGNGTVTRHHPRSGDAAVKVDDSGRILLPASYRLDDAPRFEKFYLVYADAAFGLETVRQALEASGGEHDLALDETYKIETFLLRKAAR